MNKRLLLIASLTSKTSWMKLHEILILEAIVTEVTLCVHHRQFGHTMAVKNEEKNLFLCFMLYIYFIFLNSSVQLMYFLFSEKTLKGFLCSVMWCQLF